MKNEKKLLMCQKNDPVIWKTDHIVIGKFSENKTCTGYIQKQVVKKKLQTE